MGRKRTTPVKKPAAKKTEPELLFEDGYYWIVSGTKRLNVGRNHRYAENMLEEQKAK